MIEDVCGLNTSSIVEQLFFLKADVGGQSGQ
jgi:hypothetical protein